MLFLLTPVSANMPHSDGIIRDYCYMQEYNIYYKENGTTQETIIYWDTCPRYSHEDTIDCQSIRVRDWKLIQSEFIIPRYDPSTRKFKALFHDSKCGQGVTREVTSDLYKKSKHSMILK